MVSNVLSNSHVGSFQRGVGLALELIVFGTSSGITVHGAENAIGAQTLSSTLDQGIVWITDHYDPFLDAGLTDLVLQEHVISEARRDEYWLRHVRRPTTHSIFAKSFVDSSKRLVYFFERNKGISYDRSIEDDRAAEALRVSGVTSVVLEAGGGVWAAREGRVRRMDLVQQIPRLLIFLIDITSEVVCLLRSFLIEHSICLFRLRMIDCRLCICLRMNSG